MRKIFFVVLICLIGVMVGFVSAEEKIPIPEFYGLYFVSDGNLIPAREAVRENRTKLVGGSFDTVPTTGVKELSGISLSPRSYFLLYQKLTDGTVGLRLFKLEFAKQLSPEVSGSLSGKWYEANMWILKKEIPMNVGPIKEQPDLYRLVPTLQLEDGVYALITTSKMNILGFNVETIGNFVSDFVVGKIPETQSMLGKSIMDKFDGSTLGNSYGITYVKTSYGGGAMFSRINESRIQYAFSQGVPREGTLEFWIKVDSGYRYSNFKLLENQDEALIFTTDIAGGDVTWPGSAWLWVKNNGEVSFNIALEKYHIGEGILKAQGTDFRFGTWHSIGISFGSKGQHIMVDGKLVASNPHNTQRLGSGGNHNEPVDIPTIGESVSGFWKNNQHEGGFEGIVVRFRASMIQTDWLLSAKTPSEATPSQPSSQLPPETTEKITIDSVTKNLPYGNYNTGQFGAVEKTYNVTFDDAWAAANKVISGQREKIVTSDRDKGILIGQGEGMGVKHWTAAIIEEITDYSVKITVKSVGYKVQGEQNVKLGPINFQIKTKSDTDRGVTVASYSSIIHNNLEKELKSKVKQPPYFVTIEAKEYEVSGDIFTGKKEGRVFKDEKGTVIKDIALAKKIAQAAWVYENVVKAPGIPNSERVSAILETHKSLRRYEVVQNILARASVQILAATISGGTTLTYTVPAGLTWRVVRDQFVNLKGLLSLTGRQGLEEALSKYQQMESLIANLKPNHIDEATAAEIRKLYESAYGLDLPYRALLISLMPKKGRELVDKALKDIGDELLRTLPLSDAAISDAVLTNRELFDLQGKMDDALTANPALKEYYEKLNLAKRLKEANEQVITAWAESAVQHKD